MQPASHGALSNPPANAILALQAYLQEPSFHELAELRAELRALHELRGPSGFSPLHEQRRPPVTIGNPTLWATLRARTISCAVNGGGEGVYFG